MDISLDGSIAVVTGGGRGIGKTISLTLAQAGATVIVVGLTREELQKTTEEIREQDGQAVPAVADVSDEEQVSMLFQRISESIGAIDILVNNAAITGPTAPVVKVEREDWEKVLSINLTGPFLCCKHVVPSMMIRKNGCIVNIASMAGKVASPMLAPYSVSKWGLIGLTRTLAQECGAHNIRVNSVSPGPVQGEKIRQIMRERANATGESFEDVQKFYTEKAALGRMVDADDVATMVLYLVSDQSRNITGQDFEVSAGWAL